MELLYECCFVGGECVMTDKKMERIYAYISFSVIYLLPLITLLLLYGTIRRVVAGINQRNQRSVDLWAGIRV